MLNLPKRIYIKEVGPRDGLQIEKTFVPTATKIEMIDRLSQCGFADIQSAAFVHPKAVPNMADKYIPICCGVAGAALGVAGLYLGLPEFPAHDPLTALAVGIVSGLAATGVNQAVKQLGK